MVRGTAPIHQIQVIRNNRYVYAAQPRAREAFFVWRDQDAKAGDAYYYIRVQQEDGQMAWVTPIWVSYEPK